MDKAKEAFIKKLKENIDNKNIIAAFKKYDMGDFLDPMFSKDFYTENPVPIGSGQKGGQPLAIARMINYLSPDKNSKILEIGTGSGFSTAVLSDIVKEVVTIEYHEEIALAAKNRVENLGIKNVKFLAGNVFEYDSNTEYYDGIIIFASLHERPLYFFRFLKKNGVLVYPMGPPFQQQIAVLKRNTGKVDDREYEISFNELCEFTPIVEMYE